MENPAAMGCRRQGERASSNFSATCRRLSQYLREKGSFGELSLGMAAATAPRHVEGKPEALRTLNLLPGVEASPGAASDPVSEHSVEILPRRPVLPDLNRDQKAAQMTIFYGGRVVVFNNFPAEKAKELVDMAGRVCPPPAKSSPGEQPAAVSAPPPQNQPPAPATANAAPTSETAAPPVTAAAAATAMDDAATSVVPKKEAAPQNPTAPASSDMPIARRVSLHRFLEKRKDRITAKAPYQVNASAGAPGSSSSPPDKGEGDSGPWLGLAPQTSKAGEDSAGGWRPPAKSAAASCSDMS